MIVGSKVRVRENGSIREGENVIIGRIADKFRKSTGVVTKILTDNRVRVEFTKDENEEGGLGSGSLKCPTNWLMYV